MGWIYQYLQILGEEKKKKDFSSEKRNLFRSGELLSKFTIKTKT